MQVDRRVAIGVGVAFVGMIAVIFFLLGRESTHRRSAQPSGEPARTGEPENAPVEAPASPPIATGSPSAPPTPPIAVAPMTRAASADEAGAVRDYFAKMDAIQVFTGSTDTNEFSTTLLAGAMNGDMSGFDNVLKLVQDGAARARAITPPAPCRTYHANMLRLLDDGVDLLRQLTDAMKTKDPNVLAALATSANSLQTRANALDADGKALKTTFGISN